MVIFSHKTNKIKIKVIDTPEKEPEDKMDSYFKCITECDLDDRSCQTTCIEILKND